MEEIPGKLLKVTELDDQRKSYFLIHVFGSTDVDSKMSNEHVRSSLSRKFGA